MKQALLGRRALFAVLGVLILVGAYCGIRSVVTTIKLPGAENGSLLVSPAVSQTQNAPGVGATPTLPLELVPDAGLLPTWQDPNRVTVLLMGIDQRRGLTAEKAYRTDSMMLLSIDPIGQTVSALSLPRDIWVTVPGFEDKQKLTNANFLGDTYELPGGGPALLKQTIALNFGIPVDYYVRVNFTAFETLINEIGGISVTVPERIEDLKYPDEAYGFDPFVIEAGEHLLDGRTALKYARTRATYNGDFDRAKRQQQVLMAVRSKLLDLNMLPLLLAKSPVLYNTLVDSFDSDLTLEQMIALGRLGAAVPNENIHSAALDTSYVLAYHTTPDGQQVVILDIFKFRKLREEMFYIPAIPPNSVANALPTLAPQEKARIAILEGAGRVGFAQKIAAVLKAQGFNVVHVGDSIRQDYVSSNLTDYSGNPRTLQSLANIFQISPVNVTFSTNNTADENNIDVRLVLGADAQIPKP